MVLPVQLLYPCNYSKERASKHAMPMALVIPVNSFLLTPKLIHHVFPASSSCPFQYHANSPTIPTISRLTHLHISPTLISNRARSRPILRASSKDDRGQENDELPEWGDDQQSGVTDTENLHTSSHENSNVNAGDESQNQAPASASYVDEWGEKANLEDGWSDTKLSDADPPTMDVDDEWGGDPKSMAAGPGNIYTFSFESSNGNIGDKPEKGAPASASYVDEWGEKSNAEDGWRNTELSDADPPALDDDDEWGKQLDGNGSAGISQGSIEVDTGSSDSKLAELKRCLVDCLYGTEYGLRASSQTRAEIAELISELEAQNPIPAPTEAPSLLQGRWILAYTSFSELLPLIAVGTLPFAKLGKICQVIDTGAFTVENSASYIGPFATFSFRALASFEVLSPKRIQVKFEEGIIPPPEITGNIDIAATVEILGQKIDVSSFQGSLYPFREATSSIARVISGLPPIKVPIRRDGPRSWLLTTYLDKDLRISRGDGGGLFVLVKEGSSLSSL